MTQLFKQKYRSALAVIAAIASGALLLAAPQTSAQGAWPIKPVRIIVPFAAGGPGDVLGRTLASELATAFGQPFIVENRAGGGGNIGADVVAKSAKDGYTLVLGTVGTHAINKSLYSSMPYDPQKDFAPISLVAELSNVMVINAEKANARGIHTVADFIKYARANPDKINAASAGSGTSSHLAIELFKNLAGVSMAHIPYRGSGPALVDLISGNADVMFDNPLSAMQQVKGGKLKALGMTSAQRNPAFPDIPTVAEAGPLKGFVVNTWFGLLAPAGTPAEVVNRLHQEVVKALNNPSVKERLLAQGGAVPKTTTPQEFAHLIDTEITKWAAVVKASGAKVD
jgi:tripartite-type tricarboxylate transporter receptor subunit TctC